MLIKRIITRLIDLRIDMECRRKRNKISNSADAVFNAPSSSTESDYKTLWKHLGENPNLFYCRIYQTINGNESSRYVPENIYYKKIEPVLNNRAFSLAYADKGFYPVLTGRMDLLPEVFLKGTAGTLYDTEMNAVDAGKDPAELLPPGEELVLKPATDSAGGRGVVLLKTIDNHSIEIEKNKIDRSEFRSFLEKIYANNFVIQRKVKQHSWFSSYNESSVNTIRMMTYRSPVSGKVHYLRSVLRYGRPGSIVDNQASGGLSCGVDSAGKVQDFAVDKYGRRSDQLPVTESVPGFAEMQSAAIEIAAKYPYHRILGFDFCVEENGEVKLLEINTKNLEINFIQMNLGPLFAEFTEEVIDYCSNHPRTVVLDWDISL
jgi:hypothetical protein